MRNALSRSLGGTLLLLLPLLPAAANPTPDPEPGPDPLGRGETVLVSGGEEPTPYDPRVGAPALSADGTTAAYATYPFDGGGENGIEIKDLATGTRFTIGNPDDLSAAPSLDRTGSRVAFLSDRTGGSPNSGRISEVDVLVRDLTTESSADVLTGGDDDLPYQRTRWCEPEIGSEFEASVAERCGPQLSADGRTVAWTATQSVIAPAMEQSVFGEENVTYLDPGRSTVATLDFGRFETQVQWAITARTNRPITFTEAVVRRGADDFAVVPSDSDYPDCAGMTIRAGGGDQPDTCVVTVTFARTGRCAGVTGLLQLEATTQRGRTAVALVGDDEPPTCFGAGREPAVDPEPIPLRGSAARAEGCTPPRRIPFLGWSPPTQDSYRTEVAPETPVGMTGFTFVEIRNTQGPDRTVRFVTEDCALQLVTPGDIGITTPACTPGLVVPSGDGCIAYVAFQPENLLPSVATLSLDSGVSSAAQHVRFVGAGVEDVVALRRDRDGDGDFTDDGAPSVVSVDSQGRRLPGRTPSLSADGRYVAFASADRITPYDGPMSQVLLHDTTRTGRPGSTITVSRQGPGAAGLPDDAVQPSLSGDASRIAYVTRDYIPNLEDYAVRVRVRELDSGLRLVASAPAGASAPSRDDGWAPALSLDGSTVAFTSDSAGLVPDKVRVCEYCAATYVRDLGATLGEGPAALLGPELVSLDTQQSWLDEPAGLPAINRDGGAIAFLTSAMLVGADYPYDSVYLRARAPELVLDPTALDVGVVELQAEPVGNPVIVTNNGPGPGTVSAEAPAPFTILPDSDAAGTESSCVGRLLHRGESCTLQVAFVPEVRGTVESEVTVTATPSAAAFSDLAWAVSLPVSGTGMPQLLRLAPAELTFPETDLGITSEPLSLRVTNVLDLTLSLDASLSSGGLDFAVTTPERCAALKPGASCSVSVTFTPITPGERSGLLLLVPTVAEVAYPQEVPVSGTAAEPAVAFSPTVAHEGRVTFVQGAGFAPGRPVFLTWADGSSAGPAVVPADDGTFDAPVLVLAGGGTGPRPLTVTAPFPAGLLALLTELLAPAPDPNLPDGEQVEPELPEPVVVETEVLVVPGSAQPPDFVTRN